MPEAAAKSYRIVRLESENIKRLKAVAIEPQGNLIEITGANDAGKTSLLDSIFWALSGKSAIQRTPVRAGEQTARIQLDLGEVIVTRKFSVKEGEEFTSTVTVETPDGLKASKPHQFLSDLIGELSFDPLAFTEMRAKEQFDALKQFVPGVDFDAIAAENKKDFDARTDVNRRVREARAQANAVEVAEDTPDQPVDESALVAELESAGEANAQIERRRANREAVAAGIQRRDEENVVRSNEIHRLQQRIKEIQAEIDQANAENHADQKRLEQAGPLPDPVSTADIRERIDAARRTNAAVQAKTRRKDLERQAKEAEALSLALTKSIEEREAAKAKAIAAAKMPVEGMGFGEDYITLNGQPFDQASKAQQLRASIALAMAANPKLRVILVRQGAFLDSQMMQLVADMAEKHDAQVWVETVESSRPGAIVIEDGSIKADTMQAAE